MWIFFKENVGIALTIKTATAKRIAPQKKGLVIKEESGHSKDMTRGLIAKAAAAGAGVPVK